MTDSFVGFYLLLLETERAKDNAVAVATRLAEVLREVHQAPNRMVSWNHAFDALRDYDIMMGNPVPEEDDAE